MVSFNATGMNAGAYFYYAWNGCSALTTFPAGVFDDWNPASITANCFLEAWGGCADLTEQSVQNILHSIAASGQSAPSSGKEITIDSNNVDVNDLNATIRASCAALLSRGWEVVINDSIVDEYSINFNGTDEYVDCGAVSEIPSATDLTVSAWVKNEDITANTVLFGDDTSATAIFSVEHWGSVDRLYFEYGGSKYCWATLSNYVSDDEWHHFALVYDGGGASNSDKIKIYINGVSTSLTFEGGVVPTALDASIGDLWIGDGAKYNSPFKGSIDEFSIWDVALDADAVTAVYNAGQPINLSEAEGNYDNEGDLVSWWRMGDNDGGAGLLVRPIRMLYTFQGSLPTTRVSPMLRTWMGLGTSRSKWTM